MSHLKHTEMLPSYPLADLVDRLIAQADRPARVFGSFHYGGNIYSSGPNIRAGLGINERSHYGWRTGERPSVGIDTADMILTRAGMVWWDVWNEDTVRRYALTATTYQQRWKNVAGKRREFRMTVRTRRYVDLGPDLVELERIRLLWEPAYDASLEMAA